MAARITQLDGVRALAIVAVFLNHAFKAKLLWMGVDLFFVLSGFLITRILLSARSGSFKTYIGAFYERRFRRILPAYLLLLVVTSILFGLAWIRNWYMYVFLMNFLRPFDIPHPLSLRVLWSLAVEEQFYLVWPFVVYLLSEDLLIWFAGAVVVSAPVLRWVFTTHYATHWAIYSLTPFRMDTLAVGALLAIAWRRHQPLIARFGAFGLSLSAFAIGALLLLSRAGISTSGNTHLGNVSIYELSLMISTGILLWALSGKGVAMLKLAPVRYLGRISYSVYLIHLTALVALERYLNGAVAIAALAFAISILYASASWFLLEKPLIQRKTATAPTLAALREA